MKKPKIKIPYDLDHVRRMFAGATFPAEVLTVLEPKHIEPGRFQRLYAFVRRLLLPIVSRTPFGAFWKWRWDQMRRVSRERATVKVTEQSWGQIQASLKSLEEKVAALSVEADAIRPQIERRTPPARCCPKCQTPLIRGRYGSPPTDGWVCPNVPRDDEPATDDHCTGYVEP